MCPGRPACRLNPRSGAHLDIHHGDPPDAVWKPGKYRAVVQGLDPDGIMLIGETWITAP